MNVFLKQWLQQLEQFANELHVSKLIVGNKSDLANEREVEFDVSKAFANSHNIPCTFHFIYLFIFFLIY